MSEQTIITVPEERTIGIITTEIKALHAQAQQIILGYAIEIGRRLKEAKAMLPYGAWGDWLRDEVAFSKSTANNFMRIFEEYGSEQLGFFGPEAKSQTLGNLSYTKALKLLAIPEEEREEFVEVNHVEDISSRELDRLIKERDDAKAAQAAAEQRAEAAEQKAAELPKALEEKNSAIDALSESALKFEAQAKAAREDAEKAQAEAVKARAEAETAKAAAKTAKDKLKAMKENPEIPADTMEKLRAEAAAAAEKAAAEKLEQQLKEAQEKADKADKAAKDAEEKAAKAEKERAALEKKLALTDADTVLFKAQFEALQETFNKCHGLLMKIETNSQETAEKLKKAMNAVLDGMKRRV